MKNIELIRTVSENELVSAISDIVLKTLRKYAKGEYEELSNFDIADIENRITYWLEMEIIEEKC